MELIEFMTSDEGARLVRTGVPGEDWDVVDGEPELIGKRLENFTSNDKEYSGYTTDGVQGIGKYKWLSPLWETNQCADGEPVDLTLSKKYVLSSVTEIDKDFCNYYTDGKAQYPGEVYKQHVDEGKLKTNNEIRQLVWQQHLCSLYLMSYKNWQQGIRVCTGKYCQNYYHARMMMLLQLREKR